MTKFVSLFSGCGGFDYGFSRHFQCAGAYDIESIAIDSYRKNFSSEAFIHDLSGFDLPNQSSLTDVDILLSGSPCQGFSTIGKRRVDDPRNLLIYAAPEIAKQLKPKIVICENVPGVKAGQHAKFWSELKQRLFVQGYRVEEFFYDFSNYGLAQTRRRLFLIAYKGRKIDRKFLELTKCKPNTLKEVLKNVGLAEGHGRRVGLTQKDLQISRMIAEGKKLSNVRGGNNSVHTWTIPEVFGDVKNSEKQLLEALLRYRRRFRVRDFGDADPVSIRILDEHYKKPYKRDLKSLIKKKYVVEKGDGLYDLKGSFNGKYRRLSYDKPSYTVDTNFGNPKYFLHPKEDRGFSVREAARIQGFPDDFIFDGSISQQFRLIGNAVPPYISEKLAKIIRDAFY